MIGLHVRGWAGTCVMATALAMTGSASAQKSGGILRLHHFDSPASMSILEESTRAAEQPAMAVMNNLVMYDQHVAQNSLQSIVPDLATEWRWSEDGKELTFPLHQGVKWHDGKPFTSADVKCTWDLLMGTGQDKLRINPRRSWYENVEKVTTSGDYEVTFHLKHPQPALLALMASGWSPIYPCHVPAARDAAAPDRHRAVQVRRIQAERIHQTGEKPRLLEKGPALSRRHRIHDYEGDRRHATWRSSPASSTPFRWA